MIDDLKFIQVGDLAKGISEHILPDTDDLVGKILQLNFEDKTATRIKFDSINTLNWEVVTGSDKGRRGADTYRATCPREGIYFVDYIQQDQRATTVSLVIDTSAQKATAVIGTLPTEAETRKDAFSRVQANMELTGVTTKFVRATLDTPFTAEGHLHNPTDELVGKRVKYVYSQTEEYEHIYLNPNLYTWHCLEGIEKGLADTDRCYYYKVDDDLYLFVWREKVVPTLGIVVIDLKQMKTTGKIFGYEGDDFSKLTNAPVGAFATLLNVTQYG